jgi:hypothetical protein
MEKLVFAIVIILIVFWIVGFFLYSLGAIIHLALLLALILILLRLAWKKKTSNNT